MKLKKSISIILSGVMASNLACQYMASAKANTNTAQVETSKSEVGTTDCPTEQPKNVVTKQETPKVEIKPEKHHTQIQHIIPNGKDERKGLIDKFILKNSKYLPKSKIRDLTSKLQKLSDEDIYKLSSVSMHNPGHMTLLSVFFGQLGIDRMIIGKVGTGILKFLTGGGLGIWWLIDIFRIGKLTKEQNWKNLKKEIMDI